MRRRLYVTALALACVWAVGLIGLALANPPDLLVPRVGYVFARVAGGRVVQISDADALSATWYEWALLLPTEVEKYNSDAVSRYNWQFVWAAAAGFAPLLALIALASWWKWVWSARTYHFRPSSWPRPIPTRDDPSGRDDS